MNQQNLQNQLNLQQLKESIIEEVRKNQGELMMNMQQANNNSNGFWPNQQQQPSFGQNQPFFNPKQQPIKQQNIGSMNKQMQMLSMDENESDLGSWRIQNQLRKNKERERQIQMSTKAPAFQPGGSSNVENSFVSDVESASFKPLDANHSPTSPVEKLINSEDEGDHLS